MRRLSSCALAPVRLPLTSLLPPSSILCSASLVACAPTARVPSSAPPSPSPHAASCYRACSCAPPAAPPLLLLSPPAPPLCARTASAPPLGRAAPPPAAVAAAGPPPIAAGHQGAVPHLCVVPCATPAQRRGTEHRDRRQPPSTDEQNRRRDFLRKIRSLQCISAAGKAWN
jgi:hypothetical protein